MNTVSAELVKHIVDEYDRNEFSSQTERALFRQLVLNNSLNAISRGQLSEIERRAQFQADASSSPEWKQPWTDLVKAAQAVNRLYASVFGEDEAIKWPASIV